MKKQARKEERKDEREGGREGGKKLIPFFFFRSLLANISQSPLRRCNFFCFSFENLLLLTHVIFQFFDLLLLFLHVSFHFDFPVSLLLELLVKLILLISHSIDVHFKLLNFLFSFLVQGAYFFIVLRCESQKSHLYLRVYNEQQKCCCYVNFQYLEPRENEGTERLKNEGCTIVVFNSQRARAKQMRFIDDKIKKNIGMFKLREVSVIVFTPNGCPT